MDKFLPNGRCRSCKVGQIDKRSRSPARVTKGNYTKFQTTDRCDRSKNGKKGRSSPAYSCRYRVGSRPATHRDCRTSSMESYRHSGRVSPDSSLIGRRKVEPVPLPHYPCCICRSCWRSTARLQNVSAVRFDNESVLSLFQPGLIRLTGARSRVWNLFRGNTKKVR